MYNEAQVVDNSLEYSRAFTLFSEDMVVSSVQHFSMAAAWDGLARQFAQRLGYVRRVRVCNCAEHYRALTTDTGRFFLITHFNFILDT